MKKIILFISIGLVLVALLGLSFWIYKVNVSWKTHDFLLNGEKMAEIKYPAKYDKVTDNAKLPNQTVGVLSVGGVINFQVSKSDRDKDIKTYVTALKNEILRSAQNDNNDGNSSVILTPSEGEGEGSSSNAALDSVAPEIGYSTKKYGRNKVYFIKDYNSDDMVTGDMFDGKGRRLNFTYRTKDIKAKEITGILAKIKF